MSGIFAVYFVFGLSIGIVPPMVDEISADLGLSRAAMGSILGAWPLIYIVTAIPCGLLVDRWGVRTTMLLGAVSIVASFALRSMAVGGVSLFLAVAVFGIGGPLVSIATPKAIATMFDTDARRLPTGLGVAAPSFGSAIGLALPDAVLLPLLDDNWRGVMLIGAAVSVAASVYWWWASHDAGDHEQAATAEVRVHRRLLRLPSLRWILILSVLAFTVNHGLNGWFPEMLVASGLSEERAGFVAAGSIVVGIGGSLLISRGVPVARRFAALGVLFALLGLGVLGLIALQGGPLVVCALALGFVRAGLVPMLLLGIMDDPGIGLGGVGAASGLLFSLSQFGGFGGPTIMGALADGSDDFRGAGLFLMVVCAAAAALAAWRMRPGTSRIAISARTPADRRRTT